MVFPLVALRSFSPSPFLLALRRSQFTLSLEGEGRTTARPVAGVRGETRGILLIKEYKNLSLKI